MPVRAKIKPHRYPLAELPLVMLEEDWKDCRRCPLGERAHEHVLFEKKPDRFPGFADIMLIGEAPGMSEDALGRPFVGPAGDILRQAIKRAGGYDFKKVFTNLLACRPPDPVYSNQNRAPSFREIEACRPRLERLIEIFRPKVILCLGRIAEANLPTEALAQFREERGYEPKILEDYHPSYISRSGGEDSAEFRRYVARLRNLFKLMEEELGCKRYQL